MTENQRQEILNNLVRHMMTHDCEWVQIVHVRALMWQELARYVKVQP